MAGGALPTRVVWVIVASCALAAGALGFIIGAFVINLNDTDLDFDRFPETTTVSNGVTLTDFGPTLPRADGPPPRDEARARREVTRAIEIASAGASTAEERESRIQDGEGQQALREEILLHFPQVPLEKITARVDEVRFLNRTTAAVRYTILVPGYSIPQFPNRIGRVVLDDGTWKATRDTACADLALGGVTCPR